MPGTIYTAKAEIERLGGKCLALQVDIRNEKEVSKAIEKVVEQFGPRIDILINNASAISPTSTLETEMKKFDLMQTINVRGTFLL